MIAKRVLTPKGGSGYQRLSGYVLNVRQEHREATDPASWTRLGAYILDTPHEGEKVAWARAANCGHDDPGWAVKHILSVQERNTRSKSDKSYHLVVSFPEGERPTRAQMEDIEDRLCDALGFGEHQRVSAVHQNTDNWHLHVAINKVHPVTLRNVTPIRDHFRLQAACLELEIKHGLTQEPHTVDFAQSQERKARGRTADFEARHGGQSFLTWTQEHARPALLAALGAGLGGMAALRSRQRRTRQLETEVVTAENADRARHVVHGHMKPAVRRDGRVIYRVTDGGIVSDEAAHVRVPQPTAAAAFLALSLAADRFGGRPLIVKGTEAFRLQLAAVAAIEGMSVRFADPALELARVSRVSLSKSSSHAYHSGADAGHGR